MGRGGFHLSSKTLCCVCHQPIKRTQSHSVACPRWLGYEPAHFRCVYPAATSEMAVTGGDE
jgi:hypothetical protein